MPLKFNLHDDGEVTLPGKIANSTLTLAEIGALVCLAALQTGEVEINPARFDDELSAAIKSMQAKGVIKASVEGRTVKIEIDLDVVMPAADDESKG